LVSVDDSLKLELVTKVHKPTFRRFTKQHSGHQGIISKPALTSPFSMQPKKYQASTVLRLEFSTFDCMYGFGFFFFD
jgi:hypothetical protein